VSLEPAIIDRLVGTVIFSAKVAPATRGKPFVEVAVTVGLKYNVWSPVLAILNGLPFIATATAPVLVTEPTSTAVALNVLLILNSHTLFLSFWTFPYMSKQVSPIARNHFTAIFAR
jgi:hypothetical protein